MTLTIQSGLQTADDDVDDGEQHWVQEWAVLLDPE
jgi:hypothetical protein